MEYCLYFLFIGLLFISCAQKSTVKEGSYIILQPFEGIEKKAVDSLALFLKRNYSLIKVEDRVAISDSLLTQKRRLNAIKTAHFLSGLNAKDSNDLILGFTNRDVTTSEGILAQGGVMGYGNSGLKAGIVSDTMVQHHPEKYKILAQISLHELGHILGIHDHCPKQNCIMHKGERDPITIMNFELCEDCRKPFVAAGFSF